MMLDFDFDVIVIGGGHAGVRLLPRLPAPVRIPSC